MIFIQDNFLKPELFTELQSYCNDNEFQIVKAGDKEFSVLDVPENIKEELEVEGHEIILTFIRNAYSDFDNTLRIHADSIINGQKPNLACVLYINDPEGVTANGTAFWKHEKYGYEAPDNISNEEFDRLLLEDSNDSSKWAQQDYIASRPNRLLLYKSNYYHSKMPATISEGKRVVLVSFYKKKTI